MLLARFGSYLTKNATYGVAKGISLNSDIALRVEILEDRGLGTCLPQLGKGLSSVGS